jgi:hypothetical protein
MALATQSLAQAITLALVMVVKLAVSLALKLPITKIKKKIDVNILISQNRANFFSHVKRSFLSAHYGRRI